MTTNLPPVALVAPITSGVSSHEADQSDAIRRALTEAGAPVDDVEVIMGASSVRYVLTPAAGTTVAKIQRSTDALSLAVGRAVRFVGITGHGVSVEVSRLERQTIGLRDVVDGEAFTAAHLTLVVGQSISGQSLIPTLTTMPHLLIGGTTGAGKSAGLNAILTGLLLQHGPDTMRLLLVDPKQVELTAYERLPHLLEPVVTDPVAAVDALGRIVAEMDERYSLIRAANCRKIGEYNSAVQHGAHDGEHMPYIVVVIDELSDLMMTAGKTVEKHLTRLGQLARACGIHIIAATQRPSAQVITKAITANLPGRIAFMTQSHTESRMILGVSGAERLAGQGEGMLQIPGQAPVTFQGAFVTPADTERVVKHWHNECPPLPVSTPQVRTGPTDAELVEEALRLSADEAEYLEHVNPSYVAPEDIVLASGVTPEVVNAIAEMIAPKITADIIAGITAHMNGATS